MSRAQHPGPPRLDYPRDLTRVDEERDHGIDPQLQRTQHGQVVSLRAVHKRTASPDTTAISPIGLSKQPAEYPPPRRAETFNSDASVSTIGASSKAESHSSSVTTITRSDRSSRTSTIRDDATTGLSTPPIDSYQFVPARYENQLCQNTHTFGPSERDSEGDSEHRTNQSVHDLGSVLLPSELGDIVPLASATSTPRLHAASVVTPPIPAEDFHYTLNVPDHEIPGKIEFCGCKEQGQRHSTIAPTLDRDKVIDSANGHAENDSQLNEVSETTPPEKGSKFGSVFRKIGIVLLLFRLQYLTHAPYREGEGTGGSSRRPKQTATSKVTKAQKLNNFIRRKTKSNGGDGGSNGPPGQPPNRSKPSTKPAQGHVFVCVFLAGEPNKYSRCAKHNCFDSISRLKQHLSRVHMDDLSDKLRNALHDPTINTWDELFRLACPEKTAGSPYLADHLSKFVLDELLGNIPDSLSNHRREIDLWLRAKVPQIMSIVCAQGGSRREQPVHEEIPTTPAPPTSNTATTLTPGHTGTAMELTTPISESSGDIHGYSDQSFYQPYPAGMAMTSPTMYGQGHSGQSDHSFSNPVPGCWQQSIDPANRVFESSSRGAFDSQMPIGMMASHFAAANPQPEVYDQTRDIPPEAFIVPGYPVSDPDMRNSHHFHHAQYPQTGQMDNYQMSARKTSVEPRPVMNYLAPTFAQPLAAVDGSQTPSMTSQATLPTEVDQSIPTPALLTQRVPPSQATPNLEPPLPFQHSVGQISFPKYDPGLLTRTDGAWMNHDEQYEALTRHIGMTGDVYHNSRER